MLRKKWKRMTIVKTAKRLRMEMEMGLMIAKTAGRRKLVWKDRGPR